ncbi:MAG: hypothetical protein ABJZ55_16075 [Fuerstiella sp.]
MILKLHLIEPLKKLKELLSELPSVQALTGSTDAAAASAFIYEGYVEKISGATVEQAAKPLPHLLVSLEDFTRTRSTTGGFETTIYHQFFLEAAPPAAVKTLSHAERYVWWLTKCETIIDELSELVAPQDRLLINDIASSIIPQMRPTEDSEDNGETWVAAFLLEINT